MHDSVVNVEADAMDSIVSDPVACVRFLLEGTRATWWHSLPTTNGSHMPGRAEVFSTGESTPERRADEGLGPSFPGDWDMAGIQRVAYCYRRDARC